MEISGRRVRVEVLGPLRIHDADGVDITLDAMRLLKDGKSVPEIRAYVDATYSRYGTSNMD